MKGIPWVGQQLPIVLLGVSYAATSFIAFALIRYAADWTLGAWSVRARVAALGVVAIWTTAVDIWTLKSAQRVCSVGPKRQTPKALLVQGHHIWLVSALWGVDAGLSVTTFRVTSLTWLLLAGGILDLAWWWSGALLGIAFALPLFWLTSRVGASGQVGTRRGIRVRTQWLSSMLSAAVVAVAVFSL